MISSGEVTSKKSSKLQLNRKAPSTRMYRCLKLFSLASYVVFSLPLGRKTNKKIYLGNSGGLSHALWKGKHAVITPIPSIKQTGIWVISSAATPASRASLHHFHSEDFLKEYIIFKVFKRMNSFHCSDWKHCISHTFPIHFNVFNSSIQRSWNLRYIFNTFFLSSNMTFHVPWFHQADQELCCHTFTIYFK